VKFVAEVFGFFRIMLFATMLAFCIQNVWIPAFACLLQAGGNDKKIMLIFRLPFWHNYLHLLLKSI
jgi:hypothetical protein